MATSRILNFTQKAVEALPANERSAKSTWAEWSDSAVKGLKVLVSKNGNKVFYFRYSFNRRKRGIKIGTFGAFDVKKARAKAMEFKFLVESGTDPFTERKKVVEQLTFEEFVEKHYFPYVQENLKSTQTPMYVLRRSVYKHWKNLPLSSITTRDVQLYINKIKKKRAGSTCNRHLAVISKIFSLAIEWGYLEGDNICKPIKKFKESPSREIYLTPEEIRRFVDTLEGYENVYNAGALQLLVLTAMRKGEVLTLRYKEHIDLENSVIRLSAENTKASKSRIVPLNDMALGIVKKMLTHTIAGNPYLFPSEKKRGQHVQELKRTFKRIKDELGLNPKLRIHDLRHSWASALAKSGASLFEIQHTLGHAKPEMTMRYAHLADKTLQDASNKTAELLKQA